MCQFYTENLKTFFDYELETPDFSPADHNRCIIMKTHFNKLSFIKAERDKMSKATLYLLKLTTEMKNIFLEWLNELQ